jgi:formylglycine-generating enzyme required for sulfatase activity
LFDLHGNIWEWCQGSRDELGKERKTAEINISSIIEDKVPRILRGGAFNNLPALVRSAYRIWGAPAIRGFYFGFRPSRTYR